MTAVDIATIVVAVIAVSGLVVPAQILFRRTVGRKWDLYTRLRRLGVGAQLNFFVSVIGEPPALRQTITMDMPDWSASPLDGDDPPMILTSFLRSTFVDPLFYLVTISDTDETVVGFSLTTRRRRFAPTFYVPRSPIARRRVVARLRPSDPSAYWLARIRLGRSTFADASPPKAGVPQIQIVDGAHVRYYSEAWSFGNPGYYLTYVFTNSSASGVGRFAAEMRPIEWSDQQDVLLSDGAGNFLVDQGGEYQLQPWIAMIRGHARVNTVTVLGEPLTIERWPGTFGPHGDEVRCLA